MGLQLHRSSSYNCFVFVSNYIIHKCKGLDLVSDKKSYKVSLGPYSFRQDF